jgi:pimeloyl-ACP methyl ester carboxylesterase
MVRSLALAVGVLALVLSGFLPAIAQEATPVGTPSPGPRFEPGPCPFPVGRQPIECGSLTVPEDRAKPDGRAIRLAVAIVRSRSDEPAPDPLVFLAGGPGGPVLSFLGWPGALVPFGPFLAERDVVIFDQRGVGVSEPSLDCPEVDAIRDAYFAAESGEESGTLEAAAVAACRERLAGLGIDLAAYTTAANAADVDDLRRALGYEQVNLLGVSYGTRLALTVLRDHPAGVRSVILDSTLPPQVDAAVEVLTNFDRALGELFAACNADRTCSASYPGLEAAFWDVVGRLDASPVTVDAWLPDSFGPEGPQGGREHEVVVAGDGLLSVVFQALYVHNLIVLLPRLIDQLGEGRTDTLRFLLEGLVPQYGLGTEGAFYSIQCADEAAFTTAEAAAAEELAYPRLRGLVRSSTFAGEGFLAACAGWGAATAAPIEDEAVVSDVPTLVLAGQFDPITPPSAGRLALQTLANGSFFEYPGIGHGAVGSHWCPADMAVAFLDDPTVVPDAACMAAMGGADFAHPL